MQVRTYLPGPRLAPFVQALQVVETREEVVRTLVPDTGFVVALRYRGSATLEEAGASRRMPDQSLTGLRARARRMRTSADGGLVVAKLREGAGAAFFRVPAHELFSESVPLRELVPSQAVDQATEALLAASSDAGRIASMERLLLSCVRPPAPDRRVDAALTALLHGSKTVRIGALASELSMSQDCLEKRFRAVVGTSPKQFASLVRLRRAFAAFDGCESLGALAHRTGYYDQAHFTREFRAAMGEPPAKFFRAATHC